MCRCINNAYFRQCSWHCLKTLRVCLTQTRLLTYARSAHQCSSFQSSHFVQLLHFREGKKMLTIRNVSKTYGRSAGKAVDNLSFEAKTGEIFGFLGPNGAGKTTTIKMITGVIAPDSITHYTLNSTN